MTADVRIARSLASSAARAEILVGVQRERRVKAGNIDPYNGKDVLSHGVSSAA